MTWPAPDLRIDFQNATVSADTHPGAHNDTNLSLNDDYRPEIVRIGNALLTYLPLTGGTLTGDLQVDGRVKAQNGPAGAPAYSFTSAPDTGMYHEGGFVGFSVKGASAAYFDGGGNLNFQNHLLYAMTNIWNGAGTKSAPSYTFQDDRGIGIYRAASGVVGVSGDLKVSGTITDKNGPVRAFAIADGIDTRDVLDRAETATMPVVDDEGVATTDAEVESITVNEVVTALLAKVKQLSAEIEELKGA